MNGVLNTLKYVHKISVDIIKPVCSSAKLVHKMGNLWRHRFMTVVRITRMSCLCFGSQH